MWWINVTSHIRPNAIDSVTRNVTIKLLPFTSPRCFSRSKWSQNRCFRKRIEIVLAISHTTNFIVVVVKHACVNKSWRRTSSVACRILNMARRRLGSFGKALVARMFTRDKAHSKSIRSCPRRSLERVLTQYPRTQYQQKCSQEIKKREPAVEVFMDISAT